MTGPGNQPGNSRTQLPSRGDRSLSPIEGSRKSRRTHKKSRQGCHTCKKRKVKCDEAKPECEKCQKFGVPCDFLPPQEREARQQAALPASESPSGRRRPGRPRGDWSRHVLDTPSSAARHPETPRSRPGTHVEEPRSRAAASPSSFDVDDMLIFHHYLTVTAPTVGHLHIWRDGAPQLGKAYPGILDAMLSISAYHLARTNILQAPKYLSAAEQHYAAAAKAATAMVADVTIENSQAVYVIATLICFTAFAKGPKPGDLILVANDGQVAWVFLFRGVRMILGKFGAAVVFSGILDPNARQDARPTGCSCPYTDPQPRDRRFELDHPRWDWHASLGRLSSEVGASTTSNEADIFLPLIASLLRCFDAVTQPKEPSDENLTADFISVMTWVWELDDSFIEALHARNRIALILLGFFGVLLKSLRGWWWLDGWGDHVMKELRYLLGSIYSDWLP